MADNNRRGRKKVEKLSKGTVLTDLAKTQWEIGDPIGEGGFGVIYSVKKVGSTSKNNAPYAAKVEPHNNGPLFVEKTFFLKFLKPEMLADYKRKMKLSFLGLPEYLGGGSYKASDKDTVHRFLIMERFGDNINKKLKTATGVNFKLLGTYCNQIIDSLMYIHDKGYAHMDVKPDNLLLKFNGKEDQVYLIDFGIIDLLNKDAEFKPDKKKQHNGTVLYTSRDSHMGVVTKRGDLEILGYNILEWCGFELPWAKDVKSPAIVYEKKNKLIADVRKELAGKVPKNVIEFFTYVNSLKHNQTPDYMYVKSLLQDFGSSVAAKPAEKRKLNNSLGDDKISGKLTAKAIMTPPRKRNVLDSSGDRIVNKVVSHKSKTAEVRRVANGTPGEHVRRGRSAKVT